ncbi:M15 family metallopeptidase [Paenibacillus graminis]|uniref:Peptidase M15 n=1 Tax=Paenibacillus graminis TaxID=189425 RepID=A0A089M8F8_9BACL|nr:M15 family metallopeptidase [Paenibacillus graminis]AIQ69527.1 peptidase M15 [Paenibacillus graminis]
MLTLDQVKLKSQARLVGLHPVLVAATVALIERCYARGVPIVITQGLRTIAEQDSLYAKGRTKPGQIVTNAKGGHSYHNYGLAIDFGLLQLDGRNVSWDTTRDGDSDRVADWQEVVQEAKALGFEWGGDWTSIKDYPHFQMSFGLALSALRQGYQPTAAQVKAAFAVIDKLQEEASEDMSKIAELEQVVEEQEGRIAALEKRLNISGKETYATGYKDALEAAKAAGAVTTSADKSKLELNMIQILFNLGLFTKGAK